VVCTCCCVQRSSFWRSSTLSAMTLERSLRQWRLRRLTGVCVTRAECRSALSVILFSPLPPAPLVSCMTRARCCAPLSLPQAPSTARSRPCARRAPSPYTRALRPRMCASRPGSWSSSTPSRRSTSLRACASCRRCGRVVNVLPAGGGCRRDTCERCRKCTACAGCCSRRDCWRDGCTRSRGAQPVANRA